MADKTEREPIISGPAVAAHEAARAWMNWGAARGEIIAVEPLKQSAHVGVYRLVTAEPGGLSICAKRGCKEDLEWELLVYRELLPALGVPALRCLGQIEDRAPGQWWLFLEDAGEIQYDREDSSHVAALTDWLAMLHAAGERLRGIPLPARGQTHYLQVLREGRARILGNLENPALPREAVAMLQDLVALQTKVEARWDEVQQFCGRFAETLVHGDIKGKNLRMRGDGAIPPIHVFDWEVAGWGVPAADLETLDLERYRFSGSRAGREIDAESLQRLAEAGRRFRLLAAIEWASHWLSCEWIEKPIAHLDTYRGRLARSIEVEAWPC